MSTKISEMVSITSVNPDGSLTVVQDGQNFKISQSDYIAGLGVTGTIVQEGPSTATPVLDPSGTVNNIRNLENGSGVKASVSPQNGITLAHNLTVDAVGVPIMLNKTALSPVLASILAGTGMAVSAVDDHIVLSTTGEATATHTVTVNEMSDFPAPVTGVITLEDNTDYFVANSLTTSDRFVLGLDSQIRAAGDVITTLTYTGSGAMFTGEDVNFRTRFISLNAVNGSLLSIESSTSAGIGTMTYEDCVVTANSGGGIHCDIFHGGNASFIFITDGFTITGTTMNTLSFLGGLVVQLAGSFIDLNSTVLDSVQVKNFVPRLSSGAFFVSGLAGSANITTGGQGVISDCRFGATGTPLNGLTNDDDRWNYTANNRIRDTIRDGLLSMQANATETVIAVAGTAVKVAGTFIADRHSGMTPDTTGAITYDLEKEAVTPVSSTLTLQMASGGSKVVTACMALNGVVVAGSSMAVTASSTVPGIIPLIWQHDLVENDVMTVMITNETDTTNIIVPSMIFRAN